MLRFFLVPFIIVALLGCESEDPNPELKDPIFKDLEKKRDDHAKALEEEKKKLEEFRKTLEKVEANSIEQKDVRRNIAKAESAILQHSQAATYYKIRAARRKVVDKISAKDAREAKKEWPDPAEYSEYQVNNRLRAVNLNWNQRVPKLQDRLSKPSGKKKEGAEEKSESKEE